MDATSFQFTVTMPGDGRLRETVRDLTAHAVRYAQIDEKAAAGVVAHVVAATSTMAGGLVELQFERTADRLDVAIEGDGRAPAGAAASRADGPTSVQWSRRGGRQRCLVSHRARA